MANLLVNPLSKIIVGFTEGWTSPKTELTREIIGEIVA